MTGTASTTAAQPLHIAVGVLRRGDTVLISQRLPGKPGAGEWEFPGGKCEPGETVAEALARELHEELGIDMHHAEPLIRLRHGGPDATVVLDTWTIHDWSGEPVGREGQPLRWTPIRDLHAAGLLAADAPIVTALRLPAVYAFTRPDAGVDQVRRQAADMASQTLLRLRLPALSDIDYHRLVLDCLAAGPPSPTPWLAVDRVLDWPEDARARLVLHRTEQQWQANGASYPDFAAVIASCHRPADLVSATAAGADALMLGPVQATATHPGVAGLGWATFARWVESANRPVYAIGGLSPAALSTARLSGATGVAGIRGFF